MLGNQYKISNRISFENTLLFMRLWLAFTRLFALDIFCSLNYVFFLVLISLSYSTIAEKKGPIIKTYNKINCNISNFGDSVATWFGTSCLWGKSLQSLKWQKECMSPERQVLSKQFLTYLIRCFWLAEKSFSIITERFSARWLVKSYDR